MQRASMVRLEYNDWAELFRLWQNSCVLATLRGVFEAQVLRFSAPAAEGSVRRARRCPLLCRCGSVRREALGLPSLCWNRDASRDAALLVTNEKGAQAFFVLFAYQTHQTAVFLPLRRFQLALLALTRVSGNEALNA